MLNSWAAKLLGNPKKVRCTVEMLDGDGAVLETHKVLLSDLKLAPLDVVYGVEPLAGVGQVNRPEQTRGTLNEILPDGTRRNIYDVSRSSKRDYVAGITRLDADVRIVGPLWIGPRLSLTMYPSLWDESGLAPRGFVARAELAMRWRF